MKHGGARPGAGRPLGSRNQGPRRRLVSVKLTDVEVETARRLGYGCLTEGLRVGLAMAQRQVIETNGGGGGSPVEADSAQ